MDGAPEAALEGHAVSSAQQKQRKHSQRLHFNERQEESMIGHIFHKFYLEKKSTAEIAKEFSVTEASIASMMADKKHKQLRRQYISKYRRGDAA